MRAIQYYIKTEPFGIGGDMNLCLRVKLRRRHHVEDWIDVAQEIRGVTESELRHLEVAANINVEVRVSLTLLETCNVQMHAEGLQMKHIPSLLPRYHYYLEHMLDPSSASLRLYLG